MIRGWRGGGIGFTNFHIRTCCTHAHTYIAGRNPAYPYTANLLALKACRSSHEQHDLKPKLSLICTPLNVHTWAQCLQAHPDQANTCPIPAERYECQIQNRLRLVKRAQIGMQQLAISIHAPRGCQQNLDQEVASGRLLGPFQPDELSPPPVHISRFGVMEKNTNKENSESSSSCRPQKAKTLTTGLLHSCAHSPTQEWMTL